MHYLNSISVQAYNFLFFKNRLINLHRMGRESWRAVC